MKLSETEAGINSIKQFSGSKQNTVFPASNFINSRFEALNYE